MMEREKGPLEILCKEIGARFERRMDQEAILVSFVGVLVDEIADMRGMRERLSAIAGVGVSSPSSDSAVVLEATRLMLAAPGGKVKVWRDGSRPRQCYKCNLTADSNKASDSKEKP